MNIPADRQAGTAVVELAPAAVAIIALLLLAIAAGRITSANTAVADAARNAARQASIARTAAAAAAAAQSTAQAALTQDHLDCLPTITVNTSGFGVPVGQPASVSVQVSCNVSLAGLTGIPGIPGSRTVTSTFTSPLDTFRGR